MYIIIGRVPHGENVIFASPAQTFRAALKEFSDALWENEDPEERESARVGDGSDHYIEAAFQVDGQYKVLFDPQYGDVRFPGWVSSRKEWSPGGEG
jgi:hypothetical protein